MIATEGAYPPPVPLECLDASESPTDSGSPGADYFLLRIQLGACRDSQMIKHISYIQRIKNLRAKGWYQQKMLQELREEKDIL